MDSTEGPLVSFCVMCYNQERYIGEALEGAFAQTYRPLEIVISDDASTDRSWDIISEAVEKYLMRPDAAEVVLNRNASNCGDLGNWLKLCSVAKGKLLVKADGDDVSLPERTERIVAAWMADGCRATVISNGGFLMGPRGGRMGRMWQVNAKFAAGAVMTFDRATFDVFGGAAYPRILDDEPFVRVLAPGKLAETKHITLTNMCEIGCVYDERTNRLIVSSAIDNLTKGASGQAVQNLNLMCGFPEITAL